MLLTMMKAQTGSFPYRMVCFSQAKVPDLRYGCPEPMALCCTLLIRPADLTLALPVPCQKEGDMRGQL
jgi:hypothetical protein